MDLDLNLAGSFLELVDRCHYGRAARALHVTAPALTKRIQRLERQLGVQLVERGPEGVLGLTDAGLRFAAAARPLLLQARAAADAARSSPDRYTLRVGVPSGCDRLLTEIDFPAILRRLRRLVPQARTTFVQVPFPLVSQCLLDGQVDVLFTIAPVASSQVDSVPFWLTSGRMALVSARHPLADAREVEIEKLCEQPLLYNPAIPDEWMRPFYLADLRPRRDAHLVATYSSTNRSVQHEALNRDLAIVTLELDRNHSLPGLRPITLLHAEPMVLHLARRRADHRGLPGLLVDLVRAARPRMNSTSSRN